MRSRTPRLFIMAVALIFVFSAYGADDFVVHGRVSFDTGGFLVKNSSEDDWALAAVNTMIMPGDTVWVDEEGTAEIEFPDSSFLRMVDGSKAEVTSLPPNALLRGWLGSFYVHRLARSQGAFTMITPAATLVVAPDSMVRLDIDHEGSVVVSVRWGSATIHTQDNNQITATESTRVWIDPGFLPSDPVLFDRAESDNFDNWNNDRARMLAEGSQTIPREIYAEATPSVGSYDLARYGDWVQVDNQTYWRPTAVVDYVPYRYGYWNYVPACGHVWVDEYPFGYFTSHYGRWRHTATYGWIWSYNSIWSPAWVASVHVSGYHLWAPVDYYHRPVIVTGSTFFSVGGVSFCSYGTSYVSSSYLYGGAGYIGVPNTTIINVFTSAPVRDVHVWNLSPHSHRRPSVPWSSAVSSQRRDYNPRRSIRGVQSDSNRSLLASERIGRLERSMGRDSFAPRRQQGATTASTRTNIQNRNANAPARTIRMNQTEQTYRSRDNQQAGRDSSSRTLVPESTRLGRAPLSSTDRQGGTETRPVRGTADRSGTGESGTGRTPRSGGVRENPANVAVRDLDSSAPAPRGSSQIQRTPARDRQPADSGSARGQSRTAPDNAAPATPRSGGEGRTPATRPAPTTTRTAPATRPAPTTTRTAPAPATRPAPTTTRTAPAPTTRPAPTTTRTAPAPTTRPAPTTTRTAPAPVTRPAPTTTRTAPAPATRPAPTAAPRAQAPAPSVRSMPTPSAPRMAPSPAPSVRSMPTPSAPRIAPSPTPSVRSMPTPSAPRMAPSPAPSGRSMSVPSVPRMAPSPAPSVRSMPAPSAPRGFSAPSVGSRSAPSAPRGFSTPSVRSAPSAPRGFSAPSVRSAPSGGMSRGRR
ncbi:MAG: hypothetical protein GX130_11780 [Candidatus Hydrogenedens sp.]|nr:hypothetical protein [Candidatus Hydrogenedens sp.]